MKLSVGVGLQYMSNDTFSKVEIVLPIFSSTQLALSEPVLIRHYGGLYLCGRNIRFQ
jgi:hypothetical protein